MTQGLNQATFSSIIEFLEDPVVILDDRMQIRYSNREFRTNLFPGGIREGELRFTELLPEEEKTIVEEQLKLISTQHVMSSRFEHHLLNPDGNYDLFETRAFNIRGGSPPEQVALQMRCITDLRIAEESLRSNESYLRNLVNFQTTYMIRTDMEGRHVYWNRKYEEEFSHLFPNGIGGNNAMDVICTHHHQRTKETVQECIQDPGKIIRIELDKPARYGEIRTTLWEFVCLTDARGNPNQIQCMGIDVTDKKKQEAEIRMLSLALDQSPVLVVITDLDGKITYVNQELIKTTGYTFEELQGQTPAIFRSEFTDTMVYQVLWQTITKGITWSGEWINKKKNGTTYHERVVITPVRNEVGSIVNYMAIKQNISKEKAAEEAIYKLNANLKLKTLERTAELARSNEDLHYEIEERKRVEKELIRLRGEADRANQAKSEFLSRMSHELRTPLNSMLGYAQLLQIENRDQNQQRKISNILRSGHHLLDLINEVLDIAHIESGKLNLSFELVNAGLMIMDVADTVSPLAAERNIRVHWVDTPEHDLYILADRQRLKQVLLNLLSNAIKYNKEDGSVIVVCSRPEVPNEMIEFLRISVTDTGPGIKPALIQKLFTPFERIGAEKTNTEGSGLGLTVVRKLVEAMNGRVGVDSTLGKGSTFWIELPLGGNPG